MNVDELQQKLLAAGRANPPGHAVPYAFEKRIMARIATRPGIDIWSVWNRVLWQAAAPCVALSLLLAAWTVVWVPAAGNVQGPLADDLEGAVLAPLDNYGEIW